MRDERSSWRPNYHRLMPSAQANPPIHRLRPVRTMVRAGRELTGGTQRGRDHLRRTLVACSGGADSSALAIALASRAAEHLVVGHVVHDLRRRPEATGDREAAARLADRLGVGFVTTEVRVKAERGNREGIARRLRYGALSRLASEAACPYVATAHHADDQLETVLMRLIRGASPAGLAGIHRSRPLPGDRTCIRPMLEVSREDAESICRAAGWDWRHDRTNEDLSRLRAALREGVTPELRRLRPDAAANVARSAALAGEAGELVSREGRALAERARACEDGQGWRISRDVLVEASDIVVLEVLRWLATRVLPGRGRDELGSRRMSPVVAAIRSSGGESRSFVLGGVVVSVGSGTVSLRRRSDV